MRLIDAESIKYSILSVTENGVSPAVHKMEIAAMPTVEAIPIEWIKEWNIEHWEDAVDSDDMMVDRMMEDWWQKNVDDQVWEDEWERHLFFERWMKDV